MQFQVVSQYNESGMRLNWEGCSIDDQNGQLLPYFHAHVALVYLLILAQKVGNLPGAGTRQEMASVRLLFHPQAKQFVPYGQHHGAHEQADNAGHDHAANSTDQDHRHGDIQPPAHQ